MKKILPFILFLLIFPIANAQQVSVTVTVFQIIKAFVGVNVIIMIVLGIFGYFLRIFGETDVKAFLAFFIFAIILISLAVIAFRIIAGWGI